MRGKKKETAVEESPEFFYAQSPETWFFSAGTEDGEKEKANGILRHARWRIGIGFGLTAARNLHRQRDSQIGPSGPSIPSRELVLIPPKREEMGERVRYCGDRASADPEG
ncbi:hypothetical protein AB5N19_06288 [Seiridium cardinale]|uniref:Uncharacterized protein n=1 Tax=Seiridium cardinale TaxID=138064 RepID=A0ABR2Y6B0_9PEZI